MTEHTVRSFAVHVFSSDNNLPFLDCWPPIPIHSAQAQLSNISTRDKKNDLIDINLIHMIIMPPLSFITAAKPAGICIIKRELDVEEVGYDFI